MTRILFASFAAVAVTVPFLAAPAPAAPPPQPPAAAPATADTTGIAAAPPPAPPTADTRELTPARLTLDGIPLPAPAYRGPQPAGRRAAAKTPPLGTVRSWAGLNAVKNDIYRKDYTLRAVGEHIEVWVAADVAFPKGDCRPDTTVTVTDAQLATLVREFDQTIYPKETTVFSTPPDRSGTNPGVDGDFSGDGGRTVTLVDNIRDDNYFSFPERPTYVSGFFSEQLNELFDRNVMTIDAFDWPHRMGADPRNEPDDDLCVSRPARPRMYESTFAHEWHHLLSYYTDPQEETWVDEGLSDYAQTLTGYVDASLGVYHRGFDNHITCYQGFGSVKTGANPNPRDCGGPSNSLNLWSEGGPDAILADYGITYQLMAYLRDRFGTKVLSALHNDREHRGMDAVAAVLPEGTSWYDVLHDFQLMTLVDKPAGDPDGSITGVPAGRVVVPSLRSAVNLGNPESTGKPGAPPNGADYVRLPKGFGTVEFQGAATLPASPLSWTLDGGTLFSGNAPKTDATAVRAVDVPAGDPVLRVTASFAMEEKFDYGYLTVSSDGGRTYRPATGNRTVKGPLGAAITGTAVDADLTYDLSAYAGKQVFVGFRYVSDAAVNLGGWHIKNITIGGTAVPAGTLDGWRSMTQIRPAPVHAWHVTLVGLARGEATIVPLAEADKLRAFTKVVAVVAFDEPTGTVQQYAPYTLKVDGTALP
ncbi:MULTISPECIES: immune inhibitor A domain-containing protein [Actinoplanes]|uniref:immune inhibitor A domain-containing protein n=1 Tax=Actinoplanes TaxID=1865 RepID=UPI0005F2E504|nr:MULTISPECIES: immune inhibitor A domain-containing protein [Actinoplanes]GLY06254.1 hypothetical protein Acsp01_66330 [Actinoplanes sp. NBRC 101535]